MGKPVINCGIFLYHLPDKKLLACHATHAPWNQWTIPKGLKERKEESWAVAQRELQEETGIDLTKIQVEKIIQLTPSHYQKQRKTLESFLVITRTDFTRHRFRSNQDKRSGIPEIDKWNWITLDQAKRWLHESQVNLLKEIETHLA